MLKLISWFRSWRAERIYWRARDPHLGGRHEEAIAAYSKSIAADPNFAYSWDARGNVHGLAGDNAAALADYREAARLMPDHAGMLGNLGRSLSLAGQHDEAFEVLRKALALEPTHVNNHGILAHIQRLLGDHEGEFASLDTAIGLSTVDRPGLVADTLRRGQLCATKGAHESAVGDFTAVIERDPANAPAHQERARSLLALGRKTEARADVEAAIALGRDATRFALRGYLKAAAGDDIGALPDYDQAIELEPRYVDAYRCRAEIHRRAGALDRCTDDLSSAILIAPENADLAFARGVARLDAGDNLGAAADFTRALELRPELATAYLNRAIAHERADEFERMRPDYARALKLLPEPSTAIDFNNRAWIHMVLGNPDAGLPDADRAIALEPQQARAHATRGCILEKLGRRDGAAASLLRALTLMPDREVEKTAREALARLTLAD